MPAQTQPRPRISELVSGYRYPRTVAELIEARRAQLAVRTEESQVCPQVSTHGLLVARPLERQTYEQLYCGLWWDCPHCRSCTVWTSRDLAYDHGEPYNTGQGWEKFTPAGWVPVTGPEADAFWASLLVWREAQQPKPKRTRQPARHRHAQAVT